MSDDSKPIAEVKRRLTASLNEVLKPVGFISTSANYFRRYSAETVCVIHICYYSNRRDAAKYSNSGNAFSIELGMHYDCIPGLFHPIHNRKAEISDCALKKTLRKSINQLDFPNALIWSACSDLSNVDFLVADASSVVQQNLFWFEDLADLEKAYEVIVWHPENMEGGTYGQGNRSSPIQLFYRAFLAKRLGKTEKAGKAYRKLLKSGVEWNLEKYADEFSQD